MRWCVYALGGGLGHLTRALALSRAAIVRGHDVTLLTNSSDVTQIPAAAELGSSGRLIAMASDLDRDQVADGIRRYFAASRFDVLIVDTFPRGLAGELHDLLPMLASNGSKAVLVHRDLQPHYVEWAKLHQFARQYDLILSPGEAGPLANLPNVHGTASWLIRDHHDLLDQANAWQRLRIDATDRPVIAVMASGFAAERPAMWELAARLSRSLKDRASVRLIALNEAVMSADVEAVAIWPCLAAVRGIDLLIGAGGYNTVAEAHATKTPLLAIARSRLYDRQEQRLPDHERVADESEAEQRAMQWVAQYSQARRESVPEYPNGVHSSVQWIEALV